MLEGEEKHGARARRSEDRLKESGGGSRKGVAPASFKGSVQANVDTSRRLGVPPPPPPPTHKTRPNSLIDFLD